MLQLPQSSFISWLDTDTRLVQSTVAACISVQDNEHTPMKFIGLDIACEWIVKTNLIK